MNRVVLPIFALVLLSSTITTASRAELPPRVYVFPHEIYVDEQTRNFTISVNVRNVEASTVSRASIYGWNTTRLV